MRRFFLLLAFTAALSLSLSARAQTGVYLDFTATNPNNWLYGGTAGLYHDPWHPFAAEAGFDARVSYLGNGPARATPRVFSLTAGPRLAFHPHILPITPYAEVLAGAGHVQIGNVNTGHFEYQVVGGIDLKIIPRLDWRLFDFAYTGYPGLNVGYPTYYLAPDTYSSFSPKMLSTGLVLRLP